ncbi:Nn.00g113560.m01.CDS01 [Neocucurbitaria sp. VM-36]
MAPTEPQLRQIANSFLAAFKDLSASDHLALRAPTCLQIFAPSSLNPPAPKTNEVFAEHIDKSLRLVMDHFPVTAKEIHINEAGRQVTIWTNATPVFKKEAMGSDPSEMWDYTGEYIFILDVDQEGKIVRILEFLDSLGTEKLRGLMVRARGNVGQPGKAF